MGVIDLTPKEVGGKTYFTLSQLSKLTNRSVSYLSRLISQGNTVRKMRAIYIDNKPLVEESEATMYPFGVKGRRRIDDGI